MKWFLHDRAKLKTYRLDILSRYMNNGRHIDNRNTCNGYM